MQIRTRHHLLLVVLVLLLFACGGPAAESPGPTDGATAAAVDPVKVRFALSNGFAGTHAGWFMGLESGGYEDAGIDLEILPGESSTATVTGLISGAADIGIADLTSLALARHEDPQAPVIMIATLHARAPYVITSLAEGANLRKPEDLPGTKVFAGAGSTLPDLVRAWGNRQGVSGLEFGRANVAALPELLIAGQIPAFINFTTSQPDLERAAAKAGNTVVGMELADWGMEDFYGNVVVVRQEFAKQHPDLLRQFLAVSLRGWQTAFDDPTAAAAVMAKVNPTLTEVSTVSRIEVSEQLLTDGGKLTTLFAIDPEKVASTVDYLREGLKLEGDIDVEALYTAEFLQP